MTRVYLAAYRDGMSTRYQEVGPEDMGAEPWVPEGAVVRAATLRWWATEEVPGLCVAGNPFGEYRINKAPVSGLFYLRFNLLKHGFSDYYPTISAAQAAAQADYESRIRAALELTTEPEPTSGAYDLICCTAEDVAQGRGFTGDAAADLAMAQESLRVCLALLRWRG